MAKSDRAAAPAMMPLRESLLLTIFLSFPSGDKDALANVGCEALDGLTLISLSKPATRVYRACD